MPHTTRPVALGRRGMVSSPHYMASLAGVRTLEQGGSAADAAITVNAVLGVVYPHMTGIGGDAFWLLYDASSSKVCALNGSGRAGTEASRSFFQERGYEAIPTLGPLAAVTVPGAVDSWCAANERFGRLPLHDLLAPAVAYAREGVPTAAGLARFTEEHASTLQQFAATERAFLPNGMPPRHGDTVASEHLADTLEAIAAKGRAGFYSGPIADEIASSLQQAGGLLTVADLELHRSDWVDPVTTTYRGLSCYQHPPNSQGLVHLMVLNILEGFDLQAMGEGSPEHLHLVVEATKLAYAERDRHLTDPEFSDIPLDLLASKEYADQLRSRIDPNHASPAAAPGPSGDTTCTVVVDADGNAASVIQSICHAFGSGFVAGNTGVLLHNRGSIFSLQEGHVNCVEPGKRTLHTLMPGMILRDDYPVLVYGTMGGDGQPQTNTSIVTRVIDFGHDIQSAIDAPRALYGQFWGERTNDLWIENRFAESTIDGLRRVGHPVRPVEEWADIMGHAQGIIVDRERGLLMGGSDPRGDGMAIGW
ncbi:MAG TPA: gamma-glutamyltransferase [Nocardioidaceae bacterium]|nr:gamma-glutamyltransferase [Nocardioidaceae bacterium]